MGDRVSVQFKDDCNIISPPIFSHWGGMRFVDLARLFCETLHPSEESGFAATKFIRELECMKWDCEDVYICATLDEGDNSDNGNHIIVIGITQNGEVRE
jgi:hypothetical protein